MSKPNIHDHAKLETLYNEAEQVDSEIFPEMRSNLLIIAGEHYTKKQSSFYKRVRDSKELSEQQKIRLTKNHVQRITKTYVNNIISQSPGVGFTPKNETELQDQKAAELHHAVWRDAYDRHKLEELTDDWCDDFVGIGEVAAKIFWDPSIGKIVNYEQKLDEDGAPMFYEDGEMVPGDAVHSGDFVIETIHGFNLLRAPEAKDMEKSPYLISRKMVAKEDLLAKWGKDEKKKRFIVESADQTMMVFDGAKAGYRKADGQVMLKEYYFRACPQYPKGYFFFTTKEGILEDGELPGGIFPIVFQAFDKIQTTPRGRGPVKTMRPYQIEINRASSKMAEHQITLGDDKLLIQNNTTISAGVALPGVRSINYTGQEPNILAGRDGSQYLNYMQSQIAEMYEVMNVKEDGEQTSAQMDVMALMFRSASQKKRFVRYAKRFERFLVNFAKTYISLAKIHLPDDAVILAIGRREMVNVPEFRNSDDLCYQINIEAQSEDIETKLGKQMVLNHALQYVGNKLDKEDIGKLMRAMPYSNVEESFDDFTLDYDVSTNDLLALERGEIPQIGPYDNHIYNVKRATSRMRQGDFKFLAPQIQQAFDAYKNAHEQAEAMRQEQIQAAAAGYIPTDGYLVVCDLYVADPKDPAKTRRARLPYSSLQWLIKKLETQGQSLDELENMNQGAVAEMANMITQKRDAGGANGMAQSAPQRGDEMPQGVEHGRTSIWHGGN